MCNPTGPGPKAAGRAGTEVAIRRLKVEMPTGASWRNWEEQPQTDLDFTLPLNRTPSKKECKDHPVSMIKITSATQLGYTHFWAWSNGREEKIYKYMADSDDHPKQLTADRKPLRRLRKPVEFRALESCGAAGHANSTQGLRLFIARTPSTFHLLPCYVPASPNTTHARKRSDLLPPSSSLRQLLWMSCWSASLGLNHFPP